MRIIGGIYSGKKIIAPKNLPVRPTTDFAKTALFNILNNYFDFEKISVLDLFSGTASISLEFLSRGAKSVVALDENFHCVKFARETIEKLNFNNFKIIKYDALKYLGNTAEQFDIIFADPPYNFPKHSEIPKLIFENNLLKENGWFILEHSSNDNFSKVKCFSEDRKYGNVGFSIFKN